jgi:hypothetical protein
MFDTKKFDAILHIDTPINEAVVDDRIYARDTVKGVSKGFKVHASWDDPKLYSNMSFGRLLRQSLNGMGDGFSCKVTDFAKWVVVEVSHHNILTGRTSSKTFLIVFQPDQKGIVLSTHNRYRTISGVDQAASYIRSACASLNNVNQTKLG